MICKKCGTSNPDQNRFCGKCGAVLEPASATSSPIPQSSQRGASPVIGMRPLSSPGAGTSAPASQELPERQIPRPQPYPLPQPPALQPGSQPAGDIPDGDFNHGISVNSAYQTEEQQPIATPSRPNPVRGFSQSTPLPHTAAPLPNVVSCASCGTSNPRGSTFCSGCGKPLSNATPVAQVRRGIICHRCHHANEPNSVFCEKCGARLQTSTAQTAPYRPNVKSKTRASTTDSITLWVLVAGVGAILALISFFLPLIKLSMVNPVSWLVGGPEKITFTMSSMQMLTNASPSVKGLGGLGDFAENMYNELDLTAIMAEYGGSEIQTALTIGRIIMFLILAACIAAIVMTILAYKSGGKTIGKVMMIMGAGVIVLLIVTSLVIRSNFNTGSADLDLILDSAINITNGFGFWGMLFGFIGFGVGGFLKDK